MATEYVLAAKDRATERFDRLIAERRAEPHDDLITHLVNAKVDGRPLTHDELMGVCHLMVVAGLDTVTDSLTCFYAQLGTKATLRSRLVEDPAVIPAAVEELLRFESPVPFVPRIVKKDLELGGCPLKAGDQVVLLLGSADADEHAHERPEVIDFDRVTNRHLGFGRGAHRCLGSRVARLELRIALQEWHRRIPGYHIPKDVELEYTHCSSG